MLRSLVGSEMCIRDSCLNRYYVAAGVKHLAQQVWRTAVGANGLEVVSRLVDAFVPFMQHQADADNHAVREAACQCLAEMCSVLDPDLIRPLALGCLEVLLSCFKDQSWPVRQTACEAAATLVSHFPAEAAPVLQELSALWFEHISDNIGSVRQSAAVAIGKVAMCHQPTRSSAFEQLPGLLERVKQQPQGHRPAMVPSAQTDGTLSAKFECLEPSADSAHRDQVTFSCGSLAPKLKKGGPGKHGVGCMNCATLRPKQPWEYSDGAVYLMAELARIDPDAVAGLLAELGAAVSADSYPEHYKLGATVWGVVPKIAESLGKKQFKRHMEPLLPPLFQAAASENRTLKFAAWDCVGFLGGFVGQSILEGRIAHEPGFLAILRSVQAGAHSSESLR
eukprot:TRINITY_DN7725_c0_g2_i1.p1 TRINITY_DN7725_c0_g2~~TRINITY_DN7725_c0_g2_i1.p1  ORF type:complete len:435 (-),score=70.81 TRINITY_DN7725_c0_g2_i1:150-1328(-)